ncbi:MAG: hypothetical protein K9N05_07770 [Candidatus Marinimicrobia bacterium]|nr:hypothetical protein [Candidatus Neomarinimicrobiota bacterium]
MKKIILLLSLAGLIFAQMPTAEYLYLDILSDISGGLPNQNPASLTINNLPYAYAFSYRNFSDGGAYRLPFSPGEKHYNNLEVSAYQEMKNGTVFAGRFAYRYEQRKDKLWLHNTETNIDIPFYFADSTTGDFELNGIDLDIIFSYPLSNKTQIGVEIFYNVDEQFKTVFPKPNIKRNDVNIRPAILIKGKRSSLGLTGSVFQFKENIAIKKYSLDQNQTPILMRIRGLDLPVMSYAETAEERLQIMNGYGLSGNIDLGNIITYEMNAENTSATITDGGSDPVEQGNWKTVRWYHRFDLHTALNKILDVNPFYYLSTIEISAYHPTFLSQIYQYNNRSYIGGVSFKYLSQKNESWDGTVSYGFSDINREDNFFGLSQYIPWNTLHVGFDYKLTQSNIDFSFNIGFNNIKVGTTVEYNEMSDWYYQMISAKEIAYYSQDRQEIEAGLKIVFPLKDMRIALSGTYKDVKPINIETRYRMLQTQIEIMF